MSIIKTVRALLNPHSDSPGEGTEDTETTTIETVLTDISGPDAEKLFAELNHGRRCEFVTSGSPTVPPDTWWEFEKHVDSNQLRDKWGLESKLTNVRDGQRVCLKDDTLVRSRRLSREHTSSETSTTGERVTGGISVTFPVVPSLTGETNKSVSSTKRGTLIEEQEIFECGTDSASCRLNRRAFWRIGHFHIVRGSDNRDHLIKRVQDQAGQRRDEGDS